MYKSEIYCLLNNAMKSLESGFQVMPEAVDAEVVRLFHQSLPNYAATPSIELSKLAKQLGISQLVVKDESQRFDLNAFKVLGASFAIAKHLAEIIGLKEHDLTFANIIAHKHDYQNITFVTATDGNHGRAVAWTANLFGCKSVVYMPKGSSLTRLEAIRGYGAEATITSVNYDDTVQYAKNKAQENAWVLIQDTSWQGYHKVPEHIMLGYQTLVTECLEQIAGFWPTHVFLQSGVGSLPAAIVWFMNTYTEQPQPKFIIVEPHGAPCFYDSIKQGNNTAVKIDGDLPTIMAGLACGKPSQLAWNILSMRADVFLSCADNISRRGMRVLGNPLKGDPRVISGESGAVTLGAVFEILSQPHYQNIKRDLQLGSDSKVLLFSTEGDTDPDVYRDVVWG